MNLQPRISEAILPLAATLAPATSWEEMGPSEHFVQFYEEDSFFIHSLAGFVGAGLRGSETVIVIGAAPHREALNRQLALEGIDHESCLADGSYIVRDAAET